MKIIIMHVDGKRVNQMIEEPDFTIPKGITLEKWLLTHIAEGDTDITIEKSFHD